MSLENIVTREDLIKKMEGKKVSSMEHLLNDGKKELK